MEKKDIRQYLHYYLGCECKMIKSDDSGEFNLTPHTYSQIFLPGSPECIKNAKPNLRKLSSMTKEEESEYDQLMERRTDSVHKVYILTQTPASFHYLLSKGFDLFGLIESGLAIDKETLNP